MKYSIVIPVYNEEQAIGEFLKDLLSLKLDDEIIVVDDGSADKTNDIVSTFPVKLVKHSNNKGYGAALKTGIRNSTGKKIITLDSDGQHNPRYINRIKELLGKYDMVIGNRTDDSFQVKTRIRGKRIIKFIAEYLIEQKLPDYNSGFRGFDKDLMNDLLHIMPNGFSFSTTSTLAFMKEGYNIETFEIKVTKRIGRQSNVKMSKDSFKTLLLIARIIMLFNPLKIFFPSSIVFSLFGLAWGIYGFIAKTRFSNSAILLMILGMFLFFFGLIADQISVLNRRKRL
jgi:glycosyltransferase involved in cell wall biosynthesis